MAAQADQASQAFDVVGIGNAIVDVIARCDDALLARLGLDKGHMRLIEEDEIAPLYEAMTSAIEVSGGSAANTMVGLASLGADVAFIGKVADDEFGRIFRHDIRAAGVTFNAPLEAGHEPTARSLIFVTPDGERTMNTFLGISPHLNSGNLDKGLIAAAQIVYLEGYLFDRADARRAFHEAAALAAEGGQAVALSLSDAFCVERHRAAFCELVRDKVDLLFANEEEIMTLYETSDFDAAFARLRAEGTLGAVTRGAKGSLVITPEEVLEIPAEPVARVVDTTGAGDLYAAGFLFGYVKGLPHGQCGRLGALAAAEIISHMGARPETSLLALAREKGLLA